MAAASRDILSETLRQVDLQLRNIKNPKFSKNAFPVLIKSIKLYISLLISESIKISQRSRSDNVSKTHVEQASGYISISTSRRKYKYLESIGGLFVGVSISSICTMIIAEYKPTFLSMIVLVVFAIVGAGAVIWGWRSE